jgi:hypothetical protein
VDYRWTLPARTVASRQWLDQTFERHGLPWPDAQMKRRLGLAYRKNGYLSPVAARVADILRAKGKALLLI